MLNLPHLLSDARYATNPLRVKNRASLLETLNAALQTRTASEWLHELTEHRIPSGGVNTIAEALADPQAVARRLRVTVGESSHRTDTIANPVRMDDQQVIANTPPSRLGEHTDEVLRNVLHYDNERIKELHESGAILH